MRHIIAILFSFISMFLFSQNTKISQRLSYVEMNKLIQDYYSKNEIDKVRETSKIYLDKSKRENNINKIAEGYVLVGFSEEFPKSLTYIDSLKMISSKLSNQEAYPARVYLLKGKLYDQNDKRTEALQNYLEGLKYAKQKNDERQIEFAEIRIAYLNNFIGNHQEAAKSLSKILHNSSYLTNLERQEVHLNLAETYLDLNKLDSAKTMILEGLELNSNNKKSRFYNAYLSSFGVYNLKARNYQNAINTFNQCMDFFVKGDDKREINYSLMYLGESYIGLNKIDKAITYFTKLDSIVIKDKYTFPELKNVYSFLIDFYKENGDNEKQLYYVERLLDINKYLDTDFKYVSRELPKQYDTAQLIEQREKILKELKTTKFTSILLVFLLLIVMIFSGILYRMAKKREKKYIIRAQELLKSLEEFKNKPEAIPTAPIEIPVLNGKEKKKFKPVSQDVYSAIINGLTDFENNKGFLEKGITLNILSKTLNTNSTYLSDVINTHKQKNFASYLNELRINYAIKQLAENKKLRSYKISSIAEELGYNNEQAFTIAFKRKTGTTVSTYIKEIDS